MRSNRASRTSSAVAIVTSSTLRCDVSEAQMLRPGRSGARYERARGPKLVAASDAARYALAHADPARPHDRAGRRARADDRVLHDDPRVHPRGRGRPVLGDPSHTRPDAAARAVGHRGWDAPRVRAAARRVRRRVRRGSRTRASPTATRSTRSATCRARATSRARVGRDRPSTASTRIGTSSRSATTAAERGALAGKSSSVIAWSSGSCVSPPIDHQLTVASDPPG